MLGIVIIILKTAHIAVSILRFICRLQEFRILLQRRTTSIVATWNDFETTRTPKLEVLPPSGHIAFSVLDRNVPLVHCPERHSDYRAFSCADR